MKTLSIDSELETTGKLVLNGLRDAAIIGAIPGGLNYFFERETREEKEKWNIECKLKKRFLYHTLAGVGEVCKNAVLYFYVFKPLYEKLF